VSRAARTRGLPWLTLSLLALAALLLLAPTLAAHLRFEREPLLAGECWRALGGHLVHEQAALAAVDLAVFVALGAWWEMRSRGAYVAILLGSAGLASIALLAFSSFASYVGSSALSSGLFVAALLELMRAPGAARRWMLSSALGLFVAKCVLESLGHDALRLAPLEPGTRVAACAHWAGGVAGAVVVAWRHCRS